MDRGKDPPGLTLTLEEVEVPLPLPAGPMCPRLILAQFLDVIVIVHPPTSVVVPIPEQATSIVCTKTAMS